ncbi:hypothetical protein ZOD2009_09043 [Haladaptatus paucihalophilus DX253]|uniref:RecA-superfamily ATPase, KaiC/GvpD/RAD55 family n=1 Tax=Haladaptatus paucihalophilus DX253 TaxID=797209 RepID=E7QSN3_HALPU|nr:hypothetical protein [Haladaptatus paucihalophilus]EFW92442.1 hypothetical protein ZOD2009_09043 [Haladaptatus paucihalophilus DX253]SHK06287.1 hypothetical protein SAMN05444342_0446 [Haladaptatus paucihalophilus DX253]
MERRGENSSEARETAEIFTRELAELKRRGSGLLVVGTKPPMQRACERFLGDATETPRRRVFVRTDGERHHTHAGAHEDTKFIEQVTDTRSTAAVSNVGNRADTTVLRTQKLAPLGIEISGAIDEFERECGPLAPGELRVCFDSLTPLIEEHDPESVFRFLHVLIGRIKTVNGMGHFHLPAEMDSTIVRTLLPVFDAAVEVRVNGSNAEQRWHLVERDVTTEWLSL